MNNHSRRPVGWAGTSIPFWCVAGLLCLWGLLCAPQQAAAQEAAPEVSSGGLVGATVAAPGTEVQLYYIELQEAAGGRDAQLKTAGAGTEEIRFSVTDIVGGPTGLVFTDIAAFNFYRSADNAFDGADALQRSVVPVALGAQTISFGAPAIASPDIPVGPPASIFFIVTATIAAGATPGHAFRFGVAGNHVDVRDNPPPGPGVNYTVGAAIAANDANYVVIGSTNTPSFSFEAPTIPVPVGYEWVAGLGFFAYGAYRLLRRKGSART